MTGFDMHNEVLSAISYKWEELNEALTFFAPEMKAQGVWNDVTLVSGSDFARTLTSNGKGTDHAWAANHILVGGGLNGGKVFKFPPSLAHGNSQDDKGRGRLIPMYPWENIMAPIATWMGVPPSKLPDVFPNIGNFDTSHILTQSQVFS